MKLLITLKFIILTSLCFGQGEIILNKISKSDSINFIKLINTYIEAIEKKDLTTIKQLSLNIVDCDMCITNTGFDNPIEDAFINVDSFTVYLYNTLRNSSTWQSIKSGIPHMISSSVSPKDNYHPKSVKWKPGDYFTQLELSYSITSSVNNFYFSFAKINDTYKLWGIRISQY